MNEFTASNGVKIIPDGQAVEFACTGSSREHHLTGNESNALREFFRAEEDERLGRWRSKVHPEFFAVWAYRGEAIHVCSDKHPAAGAASGVLHRRDAYAIDTVEHEVACEFFDAHPDPLDVPDGIYMVSRRFHPYERLIQRRNGKWLHLYRSPTEFDSDKVTAEDIARSAARENRLTRISPDGGDD